MAWIVFTCTDFTCDWIETVCVRYILQCKFLRRIFLHLNCFHAFAVLNESDESPDIFIVYDANKNCLNVFDQVGEEHSKIILAGDSDRSKYTTQSFCHI